MIEKLGAKYFKIKQSEFECKKQAKDLFKNYQWQALIGQMDQGVKKKAESTLSRGYKKIDLLTLYIGLHKQRFGNEFKSSLNTGSKLKLM